MKERPILFSGAMVRALLAGTKTQTRRVVKPRKDCGFGCELAPHELAGEANGGDFRNSYCAPGDRLWVRETYFAWGRWETRFSAKKGRDEWNFIDMTQEAGNQYSYPADGRFIAPHRRTGGVNPTFWKRPAIFMPREASRITLEVTGVRVERLQEISAEDALAEGIVPAGDGNGFHLADTTHYSASPIDSYFSLWESINGPESLAANPWVFVVEFKRLEAAA